MCGVATAPPQRITSRLALTRYLGDTGDLETSTPIAQGSEPDSSNNTFSTVVATATVRLGRLSTLGGKYAVATELPENLSTTSTIAESCHCTHVLLYGCRKGKWTRPIG